jgi:hypothetical protein
VACNAQEVGLLPWDKRMPDRRESVCFDRTALPPEAQLSHYPEEDEKDVKYYRGIYPAHQVGPPCGWGSPCRCQTVHQPVARIGRASCA